MFYLTIAPLMIASLLNIKNAVGKPHSSHVSAPCHPGPTHSISDTTPATAGMWAWHPAGRAQPHPSEASHQKSIPKWPTSSVWLVRNACPHPRLSLH